MRRWFTAVTAALVSVMVFGGRVAFAQQLSAEQRQLVAEASKLRAQTAAQTTGRKYDDAAEALSQLQEVITKLRDSGLTDKDAVIATLDRFVENQKKILDRHKKKDESASPTSKGPADSAASGVSFVKDVAPILSRNCQRCHGSETARSKFSLSTYSNLLKGGERGSDDIVPGKPEESRLILMLKGEEEPRMPQGDRALRSDIITMIETWVKQGAKFDGAPKFTENSLLSEIVPTEAELLKAKIAAMSDTELLELHRSMGKEHWAASNPSATPDTKETDHFIVMGSVPLAELEQVGQWAESAVRDLARIFGRDTVDEIWRGKFTIHLFADRHEYSELAMVIENGRELPRDIHGHYHLMIETGYVALHKPPEDSAVSIKSLLVENITAAFLAAQGESPSWFNLSVGRYLAARSDPKADVFRVYRQLVREAVTEGDLTVALVDGKGSLDASVLGFGLVEFLVTLRGGERGLAGLAAELRKKTAADKAIQTAYGIDRKTLAFSWSQFVVRRYPAPRR